MSLMIYNTGEFQIILKGADFEDWILNDFADGDSIITVTESEDMVEQVKTLQGGTHYFTKEHRGGEASIKLNQTTLARDKFEEWIKNSQKKTFSVYIISQLKEVTLSDCAIKKIDGRLSVDRGLDNYSVEIFFGSSKVENLNLDEE